MAALCANPLQLVSAAQKDLQSSKVISPAYRLFTLSRGPPMPRQGPFPGAFMKAWTWLEMESRETRVILEGIMVHERVDMCIY